MWTMNIAFWLRLQYCIQEKYRVQYVDLIIKREIYIKYTVLKSLHNILDAIDCSLEIRASSYYYHNEEAWSLISDEKVQRNDFKNTWY